MLAHEVTFLLFKISRDEYFFSGGIFSALNDQGGFWTDQILVPNKGHYLTCIFYPYFTYILQEKIGVSVTLNRNCRFKTTKQHVTEIYIYKLVFFYILKILVSDLDFFHFRKY